MSKAKFTPGPWRKCVGAATVSTPKSAAESEDLEYINCEDTGSTDAESEANAHLIAAAPDLYAFIERIANPNQNGDPTDRAYAHLRDEARQLIAKARGEQP